MKRGLVTVVTAGLTLAGCISIPELPSLPGLDLDPPHLTNEAVEACEKAAADKGFERPGERQSTPTGEGRYTVVLDVRDRDGYTQATCTYDPKTGAAIDKTPKT